MPEPRRHVLRNLMGGDGNKHTELSVVEDSKHLKSRKYGKKKRTRARK